MLGRPAFHIFALSLIVVAVLAVGPISRALATTFVDRPFPSAVEEAPMIARGIVGSSYTNWAMTGDGTRRIYTFTELKISEVIKGKQRQPGALIMRELGGEKDGVGMQVSGTAHFERGEEVVVFLSEENPDGSHDVHGMMMAKLNLEKGDDGKEYLVGPAIGSSTNPAMRAHDHEVYGREEGQDGTRSKVKWTLEDLRALVKKPPETPVFQPSSRPSASNAVPTPTPVASGLTAPQLQSTAPAESAPDSPGLASNPWIWISLGLVGLVLWLLLPRRRR